MLVSRRLLVSWLCFATTVAAWAQATASTIRVGAFPNLTHPQAMVGKANGWFDKAMGPQVKVQWTSFNAGPSAIEALFADSMAVQRGFVDRTSLLTAINVVCTKGDPKWMLALMTGSQAQLPVWLSLCASAR